LNVGKSVLTPPINCCLLASKVGAGAGAGLPATPTAGGGPPARRLKEKRI
jgi:hypothetical protein